MNLFLLDTDMLTLYLRMHPVVMLRVFEHAADEVALTTVTAEEVIAGWFARMRAAKTPDQIETSSRRFADALRNLAAFNILPMTSPVVVRHQQLQRQRLNVGTNDLRIAAIALELGATVVTRNQRDFGRVPGLRIADWSV